VLPIPALGAKTHEPRSDFERDEYEVVPMLVYYWNSLPSRPIELLLSSFLVSVHRVRSICTKPSLFRFVLFSLIKK
jgi:hypothetical protein